MGEGLLEVKVGEGLLALLIPISIAVVVALVVGFANFASAPCHQQGGGYKDAACVLACSHGLTIFGGLSLSFSIISCRSLRRRASRRNLLRHGEGIVLAGHDNLRAIGGDGHFGAAFFGTGTERNENKKGDP